MCDLQYSVFVRGTLQAILAPSFEDRESVQRPAPARGQRRNKPLDGGKLKESSKWRFMFRFTIVWESMIVIIREKRAKVIEIIWERVEPRAA